MEPFPFQFHATEPALLEEHPEFGDSHVFVGPKRYCFPKTYRDYATALYNFEPRSSDIWMFGFPRSGTTLTQEIVWLLSHNLDYEKAAQSIMDLRFPLLEGALYLSDDHERLSKTLADYREETREVAGKWARPFWDTLAESQEKRAIKTHLPLSLVSPKILTSGCKVIYVARNPKDVCVSNFMLLNSFNTIRVPKTVGAFWNYFRDGLIYWTPYFEHVKEGWGLRHHQNVLFLLYEDITKDVEQTIRTVAQFLGTEVSDGDVGKLAEHVKIDNFRKNKSVNNEHLKEMEVMKNEENNFIRKGGVGGWRNYFDGGMEKEADEWIEENLKNSDLRFF